MNELIYKYTLQNAVRYEGKANPGAIIGKVLSENPELKKDMKSLSKEIAEVVKKVNSMKLDDQLKELKKIAPELLEEKKEEKKELKELPNIPKTGVVMRFAPSPSGPMHIGHAATGGLTSLYIKKYGGKFYLRIEDTNPENIYPPAYEMLPEEAKWLFGNITEVIIQSDRMKEYYKYSETFINKGKAYVCKCDQEKFKELIENKKPCPCRELSVKEHLERWNKMLTYYKDGEAVLRFKSSVDDPNPAMRDFPLARINTEEHPRQGKKYRVWPLMNLAVTVDDIEYKMTHIIRAKDHMDNAKRQKMMFDVLDKKFPETFFLGRYNFEDLEISCSKTRAKINEGLFKGWDDIRLPFIAALRRRGYQAAAFLEFSKNVGLSQLDKTISAEEYYKLLNSLNKQILDPVCNRYFLVEDQVEIEIKKAPEINVELNLHPDDTKRGKRKFKTSTNFYISKNDYERLEENKLNRLMDCLNFVKNKGTFEFVSKTHEEYKDSKTKGVIMHYLPVTASLIKFELLMPDNTVKKGYAEETIKKLKVSDIIQAERIGFMRLDSIENNVYKFWFTHK